VFFAKTNGNYQVNRDEMDKACSTHGGVHIEFW
jgi:hypothetical protein